MSRCDECDVTKLLETLREDPVIAHGLEVAPVQTIRSLRGLSNSDRRALTTALTTRTSCGANADVDVAPTDPLDSMRALLRTDPTHVAELLARRMWLSQLDPDQRQRLETTSHDELLEILAGPSVKAARQAIQTFSRNPNAPSDVSLGVDDLDTIGGTITPRPKTRTAKPDLGVIRWDGHIRDGDWRTQRRERWAYSFASAAGDYSRLPFCGHYTPYQQGEPFVAMNCDSVAIAEQEIAYAVYAGINFWAFLEGPTGSGVEAGLEHYDQAANNTLVQHALIVDQHSYKTALEGPYAYLIKTRDRLNQSNYKRVLIDGVPRPVVFVLDDVCDYRIPSQCQLEEEKDGSNTCKPRLCKGDPEWRSPRCKYCSSWLFNLLRQIVTPEPYFVYLGADPKFFAYLNMDAISQYAQAVTSNMTYADYAQYVEKQVNSLLVTVAKNYPRMVMKQLISRHVVPFASSGWNPWPRRRCGPYCYSDSYNKYVVANGTPSEVANHVSNVTQVAISESLRAPNKTCASRS